jgi:hypothetical protein
MRTLRYKIKMTTVSGHGDPQYIGTASNDRIVANLKVRFPPEAYARLMSELQAETTTGDEFDRLDLATLQRDKLAECLTCEHLAHFTRRPVPAGALVKDVTRFIPDILHLNMRSKSTILKLLVDICLLCRRSNPLSPTARSARIGRLQLLLNRVVSAVDNSEGMIR